MQWKGCSGNSAVQSGGWAQDRLTCHSYSIQHHRVALFYMVVDMERPATVVLYVLLLGTIVFGVDFLFFRKLFWERLIVNIGIVLVFAAFYLRFLKKPSSL